MSSISKLTNSFFSATNENTLGLANFNLEFALVKFEAPKEFQGLGNILSTDRRRNAEDGPLHKTLRKLGCLFEEILPSTPKLIQAYGSRTSEIIQAPGISPKGSKSHGPFEKFVGADGTSIWAAATSGPAALSVHLLACIIARQFDDSKVGIAMLVELVVERQREIQEALNKNHIVSFSSMMAAQQEVSREELANFDASVRAWLCSADQAKISHQKRLMLILENIKTTIGGGSSTYAKAMDAWKSAMVGFEDLLGGLPQQVSSGAILRALSSWHLYPDLIVLVDKTVNVKFEDPLVPAQGIVTVGLQSRDESQDTGIQWSITLSHLRFYGDPVTVESFGDHRVDMRQFHMIVFGSLLGKWRIPAEDVKDVAFWFQKLWRAIEASMEKSSITSSLPWLKTLANAADELVTSRGDDQETLRLLINYGRRRGGRFLTEPGENFKPFFGLGDPYILATVYSDIDMGVQNLRELAMGLKLKDHQAFITYSKTYADGTYHEIATAVPHIRLSSKRSQDDIFKHESVHRRWICSKYTFSSSPDQSCSCKTICSGRCSCRRAGLFCGIFCHSQSRRGCQAPWLVSRMRMLADTNEETRLIQTEFEHVTEDWSTEQSLKREYCWWPSPPALFVSSDVSGCQPFRTGIDEQSCCRCFEEDSNVRGRYSRIAGFAEGFSLYVRESENSRHLTSKIELYWKRQLDPKTILSHINDDVMQNEHLFQYLAYISKPQSIDDAAEGHTYAEAPRYTVDLVGEYPPQQAHVRQAERRESDNTGAEKLPNLDQVFHEGLKGLAPSSPLLVQAFALIPRSFFKSLNAINFATRIYSRMPAASFPSRLLDLPIYENRWICEDTKTQHGITKHPSHAQTMACILTFESGGLRCDPDDLTSVLAISSRNSLFVFGALLSDPAEVFDEPNIRHVVGNVGKPGISLLISPQKLLIKQCSHDYRAVVHAGYDRQRLDNFAGSTLHLSFTKWTMPLNGGEYGLIDQDIFLIEAVISVRDCGRWIADIDVIGARWEDFVLRVNCKCNLRGQSFQGTYTSIDSWEELLDPPLSPSIVRAHGNWVARLAAICILKQKSMASRACVLKEDTECLTCFESLFWADEHETAFFID